jgi:RNA polymerase sigma-70 factor, ECF subfamily
MIDAFISTGSAPATFQAAFSVQSATDEMLIERIAKGDQLAMRALFARHQTRVYRFVLRLLKNEAAAEDVVSEIFLDVWRQAGQYEGRAAVSTWLLSIARFKALTAMRRRTNLELDDDMMMKVADPADDPERTLQHKDDAAVLRRSVAQLSPTQAEVIDLVYYHGKTVGEAAEVLEIPEATVKTRMFYARKKLRELVEVGGLKSLLREKR